ncbi:MAG: CPC_1213 family protein [Clostridium sp.]|nr:CPC_1213 family protein [Clostridium sp.]
MGNKTKSDNKGKKKSINHNPQAESVKAVFGEPKAKGDEFVPHTFH